MFTIKMLPSGKEIKIDSESTLLEAFKENGVYIKSTCGGYASCGCCKVKIIEGKENLEKIGFPELQLLGNVFHITKERLACQTRVTGDISVDIAVHDEDDDEEAREAKTKKRPVSKAPARPLVRKKEEIAKVREEREKEYQEKQKENLAWKHHWEKKEHSPELYEKPKKLGGGRRPQRFSYHNEDVDFEKIKAENLARREEYRGNFDAAQNEEAYQAPETNQTPVSGEERDFRKKRQNNDE